MQCAVFIRLFKSVQEWWIYETSLTTTLDHIKEIPQGRKNHQKEWEYIIGEIKQTLQYLRRSFWTLQNIDSQNLNPQQLAG